jgi:hypothetical protein
MTTFTTEDRLHAGEYPLTDDQLTEIFNNLKDNLPDMWASGQSDKPFFKEFARAIERAHGIGQ